MLSEVDCNSIRFSHVLFNGNALVLYGETMVGQLHWHHNDMNQYTLVIHISTISAPVELLQEHCAVCFPTHLLCFYG